MPLPRSLHARVWPGGSRSILSLHFSIAAVVCGECCNVIGVPSYSNLTSLPLLPCLSAHLSPSLFAVCCRCGMQGSNVSSTLFLLPRSRIHCFQSQTCRKGRDNTKQQCTATTGAAGTTASLLPHFLRQCAISLMWEACQCIWAPSAGPFPSPGRYGSRWKSCYGRPTDRRQTAVGAALAALN